MSYSYSKKWGGKAKTTEKIPETPQKCRALKIRDLYLSAQEINTKSKQEQLLNEIMGQVNLILEKENENLDGTSTKIWPSHHGFEEKAGYFRFKSEKEALNFYNALNHRDRRWQSSINFCDLLKFYKISFFLEKHRNSVAKSISNDDRCS